MTDAQTIADNIRAVGRFHQSIIDVASYLDRIGSIEQATLEATHRRDAAVVERDRALADAATASADLVKAQETLARAKDEAGNVLATATADAASREADAVQAAVRLIDTAAAQADEIVQQVKNGQELLLQIGLDVENKRAEYTGLQAQIDALKQAAKSFIN